MCGNRSQLEWVQRGDETATIEIFKSAWTNPEEVVVSFDLFGTLIRVSVPSDPADAVAAELSACGVPIPDDWSIAYRESHIDASSGTEIALPAHVEQALRSRGIKSDRNVTRRAIESAFVPDVKTRSGAREAVESAARHGLVGLCSNCSVPRLAVRALVQSDVDRNLFDAIVTSVACGWRKPDSRVFETTASQLGTRVSDLTHIGDDPVTDGGIEAVGGTFINVNDVPLTTVPEQLGKR